MLPPELLPSSQRRNSFGFSTFSVPRNSNDSSEAFRQPFGSTPALGSKPAFGSPAPFSSNKQQGSCICSYKPTEDKSENKELMSISAMNAYTNKSHEELRLEDYQKGNKGTMSTNPFVCTPKLEDFSSPFSMPSFQSSSSSQFTGFQTASLSGSSQAPCSPFAKPTAFLNTGIQSSSITQAVSSGFGCCNCKCNQPQINSKEATQGTNTYVSYPAFITFIHPADAAANGARSTPFTSVSAPTTSPFPFGSNVGISAPSKTTARLGPNPLPLGVSAPLNTFGSTTMSSSPFGSNVGVSAPSNTFGSTTMSSSPFGSNVGVSAPSNTFGSTTMSSSPFSSNVGVSAPSNTFGSTTMSSSPFGSNVGVSAPSNAFGSTTMSSSPFGSNVGVSTPSKTDGCFGAPTTSAFPFGSNVSVSAPSTTAAGFGSPPFGPNSAHWTKFITFGAPSTSSAVPLGSNAGVLAPSTTAAPPRFRTTDLSPFQQACVPEGLELIVEKLGFNPWSQQKQAANKQNSEVVGPILPCEDADKDEDIIALAQFAVEQHNALQKGKTQEKIYEYTRVVAACLEAVGGGRYHIALEAKVNGLFGLRPTRVYVVVLRKGTEHTNHLTLVEKWLPGSYGLWEEQAKGSDFDVASF